MKIMNIMEEHISIIQNDYGVAAERGERCADIFDRIAISMGFIDEINAPERVKNTAMSVYLRGRSKSKRNTFDFAAFVAARWIRRHSAHQKRRLCVARRRVRLADRIRMEESWAVPVSRESSQPEHAGVLAKLPASKFYTTKEWLQLRVEVIRNAKSRCILCGASAAQSRLHVDHIKSRVAYPELAFSIGNLRVLCEACHRGRHLADAVSCR